MSQQEIQKHVKNIAKQSLKLLGEVAYNVVVIIIIVAAIRTFLVSPFHVSGRSMVPTLQDSDYILINKISDRFSQPQFGNIIVFTPPNPRMREVTGIQCFIAEVSALSFQPQSCVLPDFFIKRVIGVPGDVIEIQDGEVIRNGKVLDETYLSDENNHHTFVPSETQYEKYTVPAGKFFVLGDNRLGSSDSRAHAREWSSPDNGEYSPFVSKDKIEGRLLFVLLSPFKIQNSLSGSK